MSYATNFWVDVWQQVLDVQIRDHFVLNINQIAIVWLELMDCVHQIQQKLVKLESVIQHQHHIQQMSNVTIMLLVA